MTNAGRGSPFTFALAGVIRAAEWNQRIVHQGGAVGCVGLRNAEEGIEQVLDGALIDAADDEHQPRAAIGIRPGCADGRWRYIGNSLISGKK